jgi:hypothetical protein
MCSRGTTIPPWLTPTTTMLDTGAITMVTCITCHVIHVTMVIAPVSSIVVVGVSHGGIVVPLEHMSWSFFLQPHFLLRSVSRAPLCSWSEHVHKLLLGMTEVVEHLQHGPDGELSSRDQDQEVVYGRVQTNCRVGPGRQISEENVAGEKKTKTCAPGVRQSHHGLPLLQLCWIRGLSPWSHVSRVT